MSSWPANSRSSTKFSQTFLFFFLWLQYDESERRREMAKNSLERYTHYYERWAANQSVSRWEWKKWHEQMLDLTLAWSSGQQLMHEKFLLARKFLVANNEKACTIVSLEKKVSSDVHVDVCWHIGSCVHKPLQMKKNYWLTLHYSYHFVVLKHLF